MSILLVALGVLSEGDELTFQQSAYSPRLATSRPGSPPEHDGDAQKNGENRDRSREPAPLPPLARLAVRELELLAAPRAPLSRSDLLRPEPKADVAFGTA